MKISATCVGGRIVLAAAFVCSVGALCATNVEAAGRFRGRGRSYDNYSNYSTSNYSTNVSSTSTYSSPSYSSQNGSVQLVSGTGENATPTVSTASYSVESSVTQYSSGGDQWQGEAQRRAQIQASRRSVHHPLAVTWGGFEGAGMGQTADQAIRNCCYWGTRPVIAIGTAQSSDGTWFATVLYR